MPRKSYKDEKDKAVIVSVSLTPSYVKKLREVAGYLGISLSDTFRRALDEFYRDNYTRARGGYFAGADSLNRRSKKEREQEIIDFLINADPYEVRDHLVKVGYLEAEKNTGFQIEKFVVEGEGSARQIFKIHLDPKTGEQTYRGTYPTMDAAIRDLRKEKKLL